MMIMKNIFIFIFIVPPISAHLSLRATGSITPGSRLEPTGAFRQDQSTSLAAPAVEDSEPSVIR